MVLAIIFRVPADLCFILVTYAMANLHDVSWGTKGDNGAAKDLGGAKKVKGEDGKEMMELELPAAREDVDQLWSASKGALSHKPVEEKEHRDAATKQAVSLSGCADAITLLILCTGPRPQQQDECCARMGRHKHVCAHVGQTSHRD